MVLKATLAAVLVATASSAVLRPVARDMEAPRAGESFLVTPWEAGSYTSKDYLMTVDDAWFRFEPAFPVTIYGKTSNVVWFSMNGVMSVDEPVYSKPTVPERSLPVDPEKCGKGTGGCLPRNSVAVFWRDLTLAAIEHSGLFSFSIIFNYHGHDGNGISHYHVWWRVLDKAAPTNSDPKNFKKGYREFGLTIWENKPGVFDISHVFDATAENMQGVMGAQSFEGSTPKFIHVPLSDVYAAGRKFCSLTIDTTSSSYNVTQVI
ncbi:hypothetical protein Dda_6243 [Drechslerella dactyloides]|uniref:Uncharacterized protein n=1 Tax=Drechslerella dactyloides TaxID=74499 RepID=A0AAD6NJT3_DREDA|nr:hypothetical protein Dda_6243 [Drechslerella dactyloides]